MKRLFRISLIMFVIFFGRPLDVAAQASSSLRKTAIISTMSEAMLASMSQIRNRADAALEKFEWTATFSESDWKLEAYGYASGREVKMTIFGFIWNEYGNTIVVNYSGGGGFADQAMRIYGRSDWLYDAKINDYRDMDFKQVIKFGDNSTWSWLVGSEILIGGTVGALAGAGATTIGTAGTAILAAPFVAVKAAMERAATLVTLSLVFEATKESNEPVPPPPSPARPEIPDGNSNLEPRDGYIIVALNPDGSIVGHGSDGKITMLGQFSTDKNSAGGYLTSN